MRSTALVATLLGSGLLLFGTSGTPGTNLASSPQVNGIPGGATELDRWSFAEAFVRWNRPIFWAPASKSTNTITRFGDEARAVFGPIPDGDCSSPQARVIPREVDGNVVDLKPNLTKPGHPLEFEHRDERGAVVKWTTALPKCDKPSLAGSSAYCGLNSRLVRVERGNVEWLFFCRKSSISQEVDIDPYWTRSDPRFSVFGTIGFNRKSGEIVFFDGRKDQDQFDWSQPFSPPGGKGYSDAVGRAAAEKIYDPTFQVSCHACHDNKSPYVIVPHIAQARVGFRSTDDSKASAFSLKDFLPHRPRLPDAPFRVVGSGYTGTYPNEISQAMSVEDPTGNCTGCHTLTTQVTGRRFAADAVAHEPTITSPTWVQLLELREEKMIYAKTSAHRTFWATGKGRIHPWMLPGSGNDLSSHARGLGLEDWRKLSDCLWGAGGSECGYRPLYTSCPAPESEDDGSSLADIRVQVLPPPPGGTDDTRVIRISWTFRNGLGNVPERDDIRINMAIATDNIPAKRDPPVNDAYPTIEQAKGMEADVIRGPISSSGSSLLAQNISHADHTKWSDPIPTVLPRTFQVDLPGYCKRRTLIRLLPKRFCFDQSRETFSKVDHLVYADVDCDELR
jgi:hypothetical protein